MVHCQSTRSLPSYYYSLTEQCIIGKVHTREPEGPIVCPQGKELVLSFFSSQTLFVRCVGCRVQAQMWGSYVFVLQRAFLLQEVSTQRLYRKKNYICVIRRPCTNLFMYDIVLQVFFEVTSFCRILEYYIILGVSFVEFKKL